MHLSTAETLGLYDLRYQGKSQMAACRYHNTGEYR